MECSHDILDVEPSHDRNLRQPHRLSAPVPRRRRLRPVAHRRPMAERLPVSRLRPRPRVVAEDQAPQLRVRLLPSSSPGRRRHPPAPNQAVARDLVLGRLSDGHPLQRHLHPAVAEAARGRILPQRLDACCQASRCLGSATNPMSSATGPPIRFSSGSTPRSATSRAALGASATGCVPSASRPVSASSSFASNRRRNRHAAFLSLFLQALRAKPHPCRILIKPEPSA